MNDFSNDKTQYQAELLFNRLTKQQKQLKKWARKNRITSYRLYDRDIPELPLCIDLFTFLPQDITDKYEAVKYLNECAAILSLNNQQSLQLQKEEKERTWAHMYLYERPYETSDEEEEKWLSAMAQSAAKALDIPQNQVITKTRRRQSENEEGKRVQYEKLQSSKETVGIVMEQGQLFYVNLTSYIDTLLFFDHRPLRAQVRNSVKGKSVLNLFCYTGSFSVYAAEGNASRVESVDLSNTYLDWAKKNFALNSFDESEKYVFTRQDVLHFLNQKNAEVKNPQGTNRWDLIVLDPPTFSNSKKTDNTLDINRDWSILVNKCITVLNPKGTLYFSTNSRRLVFDSELLVKNEDGSPKVKVTDITQQTIPEDYRNNKIHRAWKIELL